MSAAQEARAHLEAGEFEAARAAAVAALAQDPDDAELLRIAGRAGVELAEPDAVEQLRRVTELRPDDAEAWTDLADAQAAEGRMEDANAAWRHALELDPDNEAALTGLGISAYASGSDDAVGLLEKAAARSPGHSSAVISLVDMYREMGQLDEALAAASKLSEASPGDTKSALDVADLALELGRLDEAASALERLREIDDMPDHEVYALHGLVLVALRQGDEGRALDYARAAAGMDQRGRTAGVLAYLQAQAGEEAEEPPPSREEVEAALAASHAEHRRAHAEDRVIGSGA